MKYISSTTGSIISFSITSIRRVIIDPVIPIQVTDAEYDFLNQRLGNQIKITEMTISSGIVSSTPLSDSLSTPQSTSSTPPLSTSESSSEIKSV